MKIYLVGGAVRDKLLGLPVKEKDYVVVGATVNDMLKLGYRQVGKEFPVFLHPKTNEEYALARMERKVGPGYKGFTFDTSPEVTLEEDLIRRDLTINAMAETEDGGLIDPYHGKEHLEKKILQHVSPAFGEDPVRILRVGRFLARYAHLGFHVAPETMELMRNMVAAGEVNALVAERVWKELERALSEKNPEEFFTVLDKCGALTILFPHISINDAGITALITAAQAANNTRVRFAALLHNLPDPKKEIPVLCERYRIPNAYRELAILTALHYATALRAPELSTTELLKLFSALDIFRRYDRFKDFILACISIARSRKINFDSKLLLAAADAAKDVDVQALIAEGFEGGDLAKQIEAKRIANIRNWSKSRH